MLSDMIMHMFDHLKHKRGTKYCYMSAQTLMDLQLRRQDSSSPLVTREINRIPAYKRYKGKRVITCEDLPRGQILDRLPPDLRRKMNQRFKHRRWPIPPVLAA